MAHPGPLLVGVSKTMDKSPRVLPKRPHFCLAPPTGVSMTSHFTIPRFPPNQQRAAVCPRRPLAMADQVGSLIGHGINHSQTIPSISNGFERLPHPVHAVVGRTWADHSPGPRVVEIPDQGFNPLFARRCWA